MVCIDSASRFFPFLSLFFSGYVRNVCPLWKMETYTRKDWPPSRGSQSAPCSACAFPYRQAAPDAVMEECSIGDRPCPDSCLYIATPHSLGCDCVFLEPQCPGLPATPSSGSGRGPARPPGSTLSPKPGAAPGHPCASLTPTCLADGTRRDSPLWPLPTGYWTQTQHEEGVQQRSGPGCCQPHSWAFRPETFPLLWSGPLRIFNQVVDA